MTAQAPDEIRYARSRFSTRLPVDRLYTQAHFWLAQTGEAGDGQVEYRVGFTKFATRMLGELVEHDYEVQPGAHVDVGQVIGWVEGFKAVSDVYSVTRGEFAGGNPKLDHDLSLVQSDPYGEGWLYTVRGAPDEQAVDVHGYVAILDATIDRMMGKHEA